MNINEAKETVIKAGKELIKSGLIVRTWGNISARVSDNSFVITPSGRDYMTLTPEQIVEVNISDCSYNSDIKPSSEKGIHAQVYKLHTNINFVIHTHQENASVISASELKAIRLSSTSTLLADEVICAAYGLPGTKKLKKNVYNALIKTDSKAVIMKNHGALCFGESFDEAYRSAMELEQVCLDFVEKKYIEQSKKNNVDAYEMSNFALALLKNKTPNTFPYKAVHINNSERITNGFRFTENSASNKVKSINRSSSENRFTKILESIYQINPDINYVNYTCSPEILAVANNRISLKPLLDDFAQVAGTVARNVELDAKLIASALKKSSVVFIPNHGALCCGRTKDDAAAVQIVTQKACKALIGAALLGKVIPIKPFECKLMRFVYKNKYSKQIDKK